MAWQQLRITITPELYPLVSELLENLGALSITLTDAEDSPIYEPTPGTTPIWETSLLTALFTDTQDLTPIQQILHTLGFQTIEIVPLADQVWERICMDQFQPMCFGNNLWICPSWHPLESAGKRVVQLDPGLAFGTGSHPTTRLCLEWLGNAHLANKTLIDYGCGSGILAISAIKCGAAKVYAIDIDPQACQATQENAERNGISASQCLVGTPDGLPSGLQVDMIIANILLSPLIRLAPDFYQWLKPGGKVILSGILAEQHQQIQTAYTQAGFLFDQSISQEEWMRWDGHKP